jgi:hypothetical protein
VECAASLHFSQPFPTEGCEKCGLAPLHGKLGVRNRSW